VFERDGPAARWEPDWFEEAPVGFLAATPEGRVLKANRTLLDWAGRSARELEGTAWFDALLSPAGGILVRTHLLPLLAAGGKASRIALDLQDARGDRRHMLLDAHVRQGPGGTRQHRVTFVEAADRETWEQELVQARRLAEDRAEQLRELNLDLEHIVAERTGLLARANRDLDAYVRTVTHDLRNPLQAILALVETLDLKAGNSLAPADRRILGQIGQAGRAMGGLVSALLQLACASDQPLKKEWVDLTSIAERLAAEFQAGQPGREVTWEIQPGLRAWGDSGLLEAVLRNLLGNAWKYSAGRAPARILLALERHGDHARFCVRDNGAGFDAAGAGELFQPFVRFHGPGEFPGLGIGLATVRRILERHGGSLEAESAVGEGAAFRFSVPEPDGASPG
jgi:signal transduction histidine kinase